MQVEKIEAYKINGKIFMSEQEAERYLDDCLGQIIDKLDNGKIGPKESLAIHRWIKVYAPNLADVLPCFGQLAHAASE